MFASVFIGMVNLQTGMLTYINAGNEPPLVLGRGSAVTALRATGPVVGMIPGAKFSVKEVALGANDVLLALTDGIPDALNAENDAFGHERLPHLLNGDAVPRDLLNKVEGRLSEFIGTADQFDDITLLAIRRGT